MKEMWRAIPDIAVRARIELWFELVLIVRAHFAIDPIGPNHKIVRAEWRKVQDRRAKMQVHSELAAAFLEKVKNLNSCDARKLIAANRDFLIAMDDIDVVPRLEPLRNCFVRWLIFHFEIAQCFIRKDDTPAERIVRRISLEEIDVGIGPPFFRQQCEVESRRSSANNCNTHGTKVRTNINGTVTVECH